MGTLSSSNSTKHHGKHFSNHTLVFIYQESKINKQVNKDKHTTSSSYLTKILRRKLDLVVLEASIALLASHVSNHAKKFAHVTVKELVVVTNYVLQILHTLLHRFDGLETFIDQRVEIPMD
jgi:hypothetical protein